MLKRQEFWALNWLRFALSIYLVLFHTFNVQYGIVVFDPVISALLDLGNFATSIFFVASGFLLTYVYVVLRNSRPIDNGSFLVSRIAAVYPLHVLTMILALPIFLLVTFRHGGVAVAAQAISEQTRLLGTGETVIAFLTSLSLTHAWNPLYLILNPPSWSLSCLLFFYILFPYIAPRLNRLRNPLVGLIITGILFLIPGLFSQLMGLNGIVVDGILHRNPVIRLPLFVAGIFLCSIYARQAYRKDGDLGPSSCILLALTAITVAIAAYFQLQNAGHRLHVVQNGLYFPAAVAIVWMCANTGPTVSEWNSRWSTRLGKASLSIFALHLPMYEIFNRCERLIFAFMNSMGEDQSISSLLKYSKDFVPSPNFYPIYLILVILASIALQERIVIPLQFLIKQRYSLWKTQKAKTDNSGAAGLKAIHSAEFEKYR